MRKALLVILFGVAFLLTSCVAYVNRSPVAVLKANPTSGDAPLTVNFDGSDSYDPGGEIVSYDWDFGDGSMDTGVTVSHIYTRSGAFTATLTVTDNDGAIGADSVQITVELKCDITHEGDLIVKGDEVFTIKDIVYCQTGNIHVSDNAKLIVKDSIIIIKQLFVQQYGFDFNGAATLEMQDSAISSTYWTGLRFVNSSMGYINSSDLQANLDLRGSSSVYLSNGSVASQIGIRDSSTLDLRSSSTNAIHLHMSFGEASIFSLKPGHFTDWNLHRDNTVPDLNYDITLMDSTIGDWSLWAEGSAIALLEDCEVGQLGVAGQTKITVRHSIVAAPVLRFEENQTIEIASLHRGYIEHWELQDLSTDPDIRQELVIEDSTVIRDWEVSVSGAIVKITDSTIGRVSSGSDTSIGLITMENSNITGELWLENDFGGEVEFLDTIVNSFVSPANVGTARLSGTVDFVNEEVDPRLTNPWYNSTITREFPISCQDSSGTPLPDVNLELYSPQNELIWSGTSNSEGKATFEIVFDDDNYYKTWILKAPTLGVEKEVKFLTDTPIVITAQD